VVILDQESQGAENQPFQEITEAQIVNLEIVFQNR